jgi:hypothetical protein
MKYIIVAVVVIHVKVDSFHAKNIIPLRNIFNNTSSIHTAVNIAEILAYHIPLNDI